MLFRSHDALAKLERQGKLKTVITQNIDNLHQKAGSQNVYELHGHLREVTCLQCYQVQDSARILEKFVRDAKVPKHHCGGVLKPNVIFFGELLPEQAYAASVAALQQADVVMIVGSSMEVAPASELPQVALERGARLIIVNYSATPWDARADVIVRADVAAALPDRKSTRLNSSHSQQSRMPSSA